MKPKKEVRFVAGAPVQFDFYPAIGAGDHVTITAYGLDYPGRVLEVRSKIGCITYYVEFVREGVLDVREFYGDEIARSESRA